MSEKHTPGPWFVVNDGDDEEPFMLVKAERIRGRGPTHEVAICATGDSPQEMENANARLISAAPDLLESVNRLLGWVEQESIPGGWRADDVAFARAAIAKATGNEQEHGDE